MLGNRRIRENVTGYKGMKRGKRNDKKREGRTVLEMVR